MPTKLTQKQIIILGGGVLVVILLVTVIFLSIRKPSSVNQNATLTIWGTDDQRAFSDMLTPITSSQSGPKIQYVQMDPGTYSQQVLSALAAGTGPDIFEIGNRDLPQWQNVLMPLPPQFAKQFNIVALESTFPSVVEQDFVSGGQIYGLPLSIDTLAMIYNKDLFDSAGIAFPPKTWDEFQKDVASLRSVTPQGDITRAGAAVGGSMKSIPNVADILSLLMLQNGTQMTKSDLSSVTFASGGDQGPGLAAFNFYLQFSNPASPYYTWKDSMGDALTNFIQGKTAVVFDYKSALANIKAKAPFLNFGVAPMPQPSGATVIINYPRYRGLVVTRQTNFIPAWNLVLQLTTVPANGSIYTTETGSPPALRSAIQDAISDPAMSVFAAQALTARSWYEKDPAKTDQSLSNAVENVLNGSADASRALNQAQSAVNASFSQ